jgi:GNAT superfamily N-acetyltransferase
LERSVRDSSDLVASVLPRAMDNYLAFWALLAQCYDGVVEEDDGLRIIATGLPVPFFNPAALLAWPDDPVAVIERVREFAARHGCPSMLATWGEIASRFAPVARQQGLIDDGAAPEMLMFPADQRPLASLEGLSIEAVTTSEQRSAFADVCAASYDMPRDLTRGFENPALSAAPGMTCYLGTMDGYPVATAALLITGDVAGVHVVATIPAYRRRGIGAQMTQRCLKDGWASGCTVSALQSSSMGYPVYERIGYRHVTDIQGWTFA